MHACCLGILQYALGAVLLEVFLSVGGVISNASKARAALCTIMNMMRCVAADKEMPFNDLTVGMLCTSKNGIVKARLKLKAAEGRHALPIVCDMLQHCVEAQSDHARLRLQCLLALRSAYDEMERWTEGGVSTRNIAAYSRRHLLLYGELVRQGN
eukprot:6142951-Pyramimonas_sp.AAC.1